MGSTFSVEVADAIEVIYIEGNIGCGKSSVLEYLKTRGEVVVPEAVDEWTFLDDFYENNKCAFQLQTEIAISMREHLHLGIKRATQKKKKRIFVERAIKTCTLFGNDMSTLERSVLTKLYDALSLEKSMCINERTIFISIDPRICWERIQTRGRESERNLSKDYVYRLHRSFETHFGNKEDTDILCTQKEMGIEVIGDHILELFE
jgi:deoxyadenosine/deoxycytidine kinase